MGALTNPNWENYAQARAKGMSQRKAYRAAFPNSASWKDNTVDSRASELESKHSEILGRYRELKDMAAKAAGGSVLTRNEKRETIASIARDERLSPRERLLAIDMDNKMEDEYVTRISGDVSVKLEDLL